MPPHHGDGRPGPRDLDRIGCGQPAARRRAEARCVKLSGGTLVAMNENAQRPGRGAGDDSAADGPGGRLAAYEARTEKALDLLALLTLWIVVVPPWDFGHDVEGVVWTIRIAVSVVYGIDLAIRGVLARRPVRYALTHPVLLVSVVFPPVRVIFSFRLVRSVFRRGHLGRFSWPPQCWSSTARSSCTCSSGTRPSPASTRCRRAKQEHPRSGQAQRDRWGRGGSVVSGGPLRNRIRPSRPIRPSLTA